MKEENVTGRADAPIIRQIVEIICGHRYWANIVNTKGQDYPELCGPIWSSRRAAIQHRKQIESTLTFEWMETISFRSHATYKERVLKLW